MESFLWNMQYNLNPSSLHTGYIAYCFILLYMLLNCFIVYLEPRQISMMEIFVKTVHERRLFLRKNLVKDVYQGSKYAFTKWKEKSRA